MQKIKLPKDPTIEFYLLVGAIAYMLYFLIWFSAQLLPRGNLIEISSLIANLMMGYTIYLVYLGTYAFPLFASLLACLALAKKRIWCLLLLCSHYAYGLWIFFSHDLNGSFLSIFTSEAWNYFLHIKAFVLLALPFLLLNIFILGLLWWPRKEEAT
jgi:hypothetical protein